MARCVVRGAGNPSISADGRWVVFSTGDALVPGDTNEQIDVYVRDMSVAHTDPNAYELVSARDGSGAQAHYEPRTPSSPFRDPGADVAPGSAISDDGQIVVFEVAAVATDLPDRGAIDTPAGQVFVRDRGHRTTSLVTRIAGSSPPQPVSAAGGPVGIGPAVISADGSTVVLGWAGSPEADTLPRRRRAGRVRLLLPLAADRGRPIRADAAHHRCRRPRRSGLRRGLRAVAERRRTVLGAARRHRAGAQRHRRERRPR